METKQKFPGNYFSFFPPVFSHSISRAPGKNSVPAQSILFFLAALHRRCVAFLHRAKTNEPKENPKKREKRKKTQNSQQLQY